MAAIPSRFLDRSNPVADDAKKLEYDVYGWFKFDTDAPGVRRLDRQWLPVEALAGADLEDGDDWETALLEFEDDLIKRREQASVTFGNGC